MPGIGISVAGIAQPDDDAVCAEELRTQSAGGPANYKPLPDPGKHFIHLREDIWIVGHSMELPIQVMILFGGFECIWTTRFKILEENCLTSAQGELGLVPGR